MILPRITSGSNVTERKHQVNSNQKKNIQRNLISIVMKKNQLEFIMNIISKIMIRISIICIIYIWQGNCGKFIKRRKRIKCRFIPSCSNYAILVLKKYGFLYGWQLAIRRIKRCNHNIVFGTYDYP